MNRLGRTLCAGLLLALLSPAIAAAQSVFVNGVRLSQDAVMTLQIAYRTRIQDGKYWYDSYSGLWGFEGGPAAGLLQAGLQVGGQLEANVSNGNTNVYVNGRRLPQVELNALQSLVGAVLPGRYWLDSYGNAGLEGGPALVNLVQAQRQSGGGWVRRTPFGNSGGTDDCFYYNDPETGSSVMSSNC